MITSVWMQVVTNMYNFKLCWRWSYCNYENVCKCNMSNEARNSDSTYRQSVRAFVIEATVYSEIFSHYGQTDRQRERQIGRERDIRQQQWSVSAVTKNDRCLLYDVSSTERQRERQTDRQTEWNWQVTNEVVSSSVRPTPSVARSLTFK